MANFWHLIQPVAGTNVVKNPSAETAATGWAGTVSANANRTAGTATFGAWAMAGTPSASANSGVTWGTTTLGVGSYTVSAYIYGGSGSVYSIGIKGATAGDPFVGNGGSIAGTTGGTWHRYAFSFFNNTESNRFFAVVKRSAGVDPFFVDGVQIEGGTFLTTYMDGDQEGCAWAGAPHASSSSRGGTTRAGGTVVSLASLGLTVLEQGGGGMPPVANIMQEYAIADGALWQRQRATARVLTLTSLMSGATWPGLHAIRQTVIDAVKVNATPNPQPVRFLYTGAGGTAVLDAHYDGGMAFETRRGFSETTGLRFVAPDPYWTATTDEGTALAAQVVFGSINFIAQRSPTGVWGTMGAAGVSVADIQNVGGVRALLYANGTLFAGGDFRTAGGTAARYIAMWYPVDQAWGTLVGGTIGTVVSGQGVRTLARSPSGSLFVGGQFTTAGGTATGAVAMWTGAWGSLTNGTANDANALVYAPTGTLFVGAPTVVNGTAVAYVAQWNGLWGSLTGGVLGDAASRDVNALAWAPDNALIVGGLFGTVNGTAARGIARWNGAWGTLGSINTSAGQVLALAYDAAGVLYAGGNFEAINGGTVNYVAAYNGAQWQAMGSGVTLNGGAAVVQSLSAVAEGVLVSGQLNATGGLTVPRDAALWNGGGWLPFDMILPTTGQGVRAAARAPDQTLYVGGGFSGSGTAAAVTTVINSGGADAYPVAVIRNTGGTAARLYQIVNYTTGDGLWFNVDVLPGETLTLDLRNNQKTLRSDFRGNILGVVLPGSNLTTWRLSPGTNYVSFFASSGSVETAFYYRPRAWSQDDVL